MKALYRCEYCSKQDIAEEIEKHEVECTYNPAHRSCITCKHGEMHFVSYACALGTEIPKGMFMQSCSKYEHSGIDYAQPAGVDALFGGVFGGFNNNKRGEQNGT